MSLQKTGKDPQRMLLTFSREHLPQVKDSLVIYDENNQYTEAFIALTKAFLFKNVRAYYYALFN